MNCHERWKFEDRKHIQYLRGFQSLCDKCHEVKHWGRTVAEVHKGRLPSDYLDKLTKHFCEVNSCTVQEFEQHKFAVGNKNQKRFRFNYKIDFGKFTPEAVITAWTRRNKK